LIDNLIRLDGSDWFVSGTGWLFKGHPVSTYPQEKGEELTLSVTSPPYAHDDTKG
jgi:hypothetical protein